METGTGAVDGLMQGATGGPHVKEANTHPFVEYIVTGLQYFGGPNTNADYFWIGYAGPIWTLFWLILDHIGPFCIYLDHSVFLDQSSLTRLFGPVYLDPSIWICLFGPVLLELSPLTQYF